LIDPRQQSRILPTLNPRIKVINLKISADYEGLTGKNFAKRFLPADSIDASLKTSDIYTNR
jgi:hypothetical protein